MANVDMISYSVLDADGRRANVNVFVDTGYTIAQLQTYSDLLAADLDAITGAKIDSATVTLALTLPAGLKASATAGEEIYKGANFGFDAADTPYRHTIRVPAIADSVVTGDEVDPTDAAVIAFEAEIVTGDGTVAPTDKYGNDLTAVLSRLVTFRSS